ncbi:MAG: type II toxin-antitoxin system prevent-host-death family antitoxin [Patescibacteria group bacterium]
MNTIIGLKELRGNTEHYINAINRGRSFTVVRRSRPIFKVVPVVDEWGDEGHWETMLDLTKGKYRNMSAGELLKRFREIDARQARKVSKKARR